MCIRAYQNAHARTHKMRAVTIAVCKTVPYKVPLSHPPVFAGVQVPRMRGLSVCVRGFEECFARGSAMEPASLGSQKEKTSVCKKRRQVWDAHTLPVKPSMRHKAGPFGENSA